MRRILNILFCVATAFVMFAAPAQAIAQDALEPIDRSVGRAPVAAEMVVVIDGLTVARNIPAMSGLMGILNDLGITEEIAPHWSALSALLGWNEQETLDRLLGSRVVLVVESLNNRTETPWAIMSDISVATDQRLKEKIPLAARKAVEGVPVFALERGDYELTTVRVPGQADERVMLLLGPAKRANLFDTMVRGVSKGGTGNLGGTPVVRELAGHTSPGVMVAVRLDPENAGAARPAWDDFLVCTATPKGRSWECRVAIRDAEAREHIRRIEPTSDAPYRALAKHTMLAVLETRLAAPGGEPTSFFEQVLAPLTIPDGAAKLLTGRQAIAVWQRGIAAKNTELTPDAICFAFAMETSDVQEMAPLGDKHLGELIERMEKRMGGPGHKVMDLGGVSCQAVRSVPLELPDGARRVFDGPPQVAWSYPAVPKTGAAEVTPRGQSGWWQVCVGGAGTGEVEACDRGGGACVDSSRQMVDALLQPAAGGEIGRWVSLGSIRPERWAGIMKLMVEGFGDQVSPAAGVMRMLQRIERVEWRLAASESDDITGAVRIDMMPQQSR